MITSIEKISVSKKADLPEIEYILTLQRSGELIISFEGEMQKFTELLKERYENLLVEFLITNPRDGHEIHFKKLISDQEIEENQLFLEKCAKDYGKLSTQLILQLGENLKVTIDSERVYDAFGYVKGEKRWHGQMGEWRYRFHGIHCCFTHLKTGQIIETPLAFGLEFGELDPYFFTRFIMSTKEYEPLPVQILNDYYDGKRILEKMINLGKFETIQSQFMSEYGVVATNREKVILPAYQPNQKESQPRRFRISNPFKK